MPRLNEVLRSPEVTERFEQLNIVTRQNTPAEFRDFVGSRPRAALVKEPIIGRSVKI